MADFTTAPLVGVGTLVQGTDDTGVYGTCILNDPAWSAYQAHLKMDAALQEYDSAVKAFFAPLVEAAEAAKPVDTTDWQHITLNEGVEGSEAEVIHLGPDGIILRILAETDGSSLRWVNGSLYALEV